MPFLSRRPLIISTLVGLSLIGVAFGVWLFRAGFTLGGCLYIGVWLWNAQRFALWLLTPRAPAMLTSPQPFGTGQRILLAIVCLAAAGIAAWGIYWWYLSPEDWQAGLVFVLFGLLVLIPVTIREVQLRRGTRRVVA